MKIIVTIIPTDLVTNLLASSFCPFLQTKRKTWFSASWWSGNEKYFCFLFIASRALLQSQAEFNKGILFYVIPVCIIVPWSDRHMSDGQMYSFLQHFFNAGKMSLN